MKRFLSVLSIVLLLSPVSILAEEMDKTNEQEVTEEKPKVEIVKLEDCVDGDTARFRNENNEVIKARFLAVDTPETVHPTKGEETFGKEASEYTCTALTNANEIKLEYDENSTEEDKYGRKLVWVFIDGVLLQDSLVSKGYAEVAYLYADYKYTSLLKDSEAVAKASKIGMWSEEEVIDISNDTNHKETKKETKQKGFFDSLLGAILNFLNDLLESILKSIEDML